MPRYSSDDNDDWADRHEGNKTLRFIMQRCWFILLVPLIAIAVYNARYVVPAQKKLDKQIAEEKQRGEAERNRILTDSRKVGVGISALRALADTFQVRFTSMDSLIDSVTVLRAAEQAEMMKLQAQGESLRTVFSLASGKSDSLSNLLPPMQARIDSFKTLIASRNEQIKTLEAEKAADLEVADKVLNPDNYRKNSALLTGEGDFPNRDALPKR
jgi:hypothetical protein